MQDPINRTTPIMPDDLARKEWIRLLTLLDLHRKNTYISVKDYAKFLGVSYGWTHLLLNPFYRRHAGKKPPLYPLDLADRMAQSLDLELHSGDHSLAQIPLALEEARKAHRITFTELATPLGVTAMTVQRWFKGTSPMPIVQAIRLLDFFTLEPIAIAGDLKTLPANPNRKPRGKGTWSKSPADTRNTLVENSQGALVPAPTPKLGMRINPDGTLDWLD